MIGHLFEKFKAELEKLLCWLLRFANRSAHWRTTKPYEFHKLADYNVSLSEQPLLEVEVTVEATLPGTRGTGDLSEGKIQIHSLNTKDTQ